MNRIGVMQITDSLAIGGLERVAVNLANSLPSEHFHSHLCVTRQTGPLESAIAKNVQCIHLERTGRYDLGALWRLRKYIRENRIQILHAHGTSLFVAAIASRFKPKPAVVWHDHFGRCDTEERSVSRYKSAAKKLCGVIAVNQNLAAWSRDELRVPGDRVWYIPNFVQETMLDETIPKLPGKKGARIVCVANLRPQKDHPNLFHAMKMVIRSVPEAHLILVGSGDDKDHLAKLNELLANMRLDGNVTWLGPRNNVAAILRECDIGVLSSASEGLPLALIEYGMAGLPAVATNVGQCAEVLGKGYAGFLVPPNSPVAFSDAIVSLLQSAETRATSSERFSKRVRELYSSEVIVRKICKVYETVLSPVGS
jgi:glycosyltransferase involved in cell wall biosynthesis